MGGKVECLSTGAWMDTDQALRNGRKRRALFLRKVSVAEETARMEHGMLCHQILNPLLGGCVERVIGCAQIGEFGVAPSRRQFMCRQERQLAGHTLEGAVGMPQLIG